jgi:prepilin-type N-terminal cleavage/methylation domain-containing protein
LTWPGQIRRARQNRGFTLIELLLVLVIIAILAAIALPNYIKVKEKAKEAEIKANLHNIQLSVERFATDSEGNYPQYLIGGNTKWLEVQLSNDNMETEVVRESERSGVSDPLLRLGYLASYPRNPFIRHVLPVQQVQAAVGDPLRSSFADGRELGTRFGAHGNVMGQTLCDARWLTWAYQDQDRNKLLERNTWSNVQYEFYDLWIGNQHRPHLPGSFFYKSAGEIVPPGKNRLPKSGTITHGNGGVVNTNKKNVDQATFPLNLTSYMLGAWGGSRTKGLDMLGEEPLVIFSAPETLRQEIPNYVGSIWGSSGPSGPLGPIKARAMVDRSEIFGVPAWTRGVNRSHVGPLWGSPYGAGAGDDQLTFGNPNGLRDGIVLWLTPGRD